MFRSVVVFGVVREMETFDGGGTLVADIADDVGNGVCLFTEMMVCDVGDAEAGASSRADEGGEEAGFHFWGYFFVVEFPPVVGAGAGDGGARLWFFMEATTTAGFATRGIMEFAVLYIFIAFLDVFAELWGFVQRAYDMLHVVCLTVNETP